MGAFQGGREEHTYSAIWFELNIILTISIQLFLNSNMNIAKESIEPAASFKTIPEGIKHIG